jgi:L-threonylcarbamoyladenylate synthase
MKIIDLKNTSQEQVISWAVEILSKGGLIIYPTETCYGLGADAVNSQAVDKLLEYKGNRAGKAISVAVTDKSMAENYVEINSTANNLYNKFLPGPVTVVSQSKNRLAPAIQAGQPNLGIRIPDHQLILEIVKCLGRPVTSTSANTSGKKPPYSLADWQKYTSKKKQAMIDLFLDAGQLKPAPPSTVVDTTLQEPKVIRQGSIDISSQQDKIFTSSSEEQTQQIAQQIFQKASHLKDKPLIFALQGELGAGKTQFAKGIGQALGIKANINSPTYSLVKEYTLKSGMLYHIDTWRLEKANDLWDLGFKNMLKPENVIVIEWLQKVKPILDDLKNVNIVWVDIQPVSVDKRQIKYQLNHTSKV